MISSILFKSRLLPAHCYCLILLLFFLRDNGLKAIENLMEKKGKFDYILLETTGLADPGNALEAKFRQDVINFCFLIG